jgi:arsenate reductase
LLEESGIAFRYRDYKKEPLSEAEIRRTVRSLGVAFKEVLRRRDRAFKQLGMTGEESDDRLIELMARHPTLLQRPIAVLGDRAVLGRPPEKLLELVDSAD